MQRRTWRSTEDVNAEEPALDEQEQEQLVQQLEQVDTKSSVLIHAALSALCALLAAYFLIAPLPVNGLARALAIRLLLFGSLVTASLVSLLAYIDLAAPRRYTWRHRDSPLLPVMQLLEDKRSLPITVAVAVLAPLCLEPSAFVSLRKAVLLAPAAAVLLTFYAHQEITAVRKELGKLRASKVTLLHLHSKASFKHSSQYGLRGA